MNQATHPPVGAGLAQCGSNGGIGGGGGDASGGRVSREADSSLEGMIKAGVLGVQLLPRNTLKGEWL